VNKKCYIIPIEKLCNCDCEFCISKSRNYNKANRINYILDIDDNFIENINLLKKRGIKRFEITGGGEPFLHRKLDVIVSLIRKIIPGSYIKVYTNGNILRSIPGVDEINISVCHYDTVTNNKFMHSSVSIDIIDKLKFFKNCNLNTKIRLSIPLIKGAIDCKEKLDKFVELTHEYVDEYVVRTLYPGTPFIEDLYIDFDYKREGVIIERDNNVDDFDELILWSDGNIYSDWSLYKRRYLKSYLLLKGDARTYINEISKLIDSEGFVITDKLIIDDLVSQGELFYKDKSPEYFELVKKHLLNISYLFGPQGLVYVLDSKEDMIDIYSKTLELKEKIRKLYSFTHHMNGYLSVENSVNHVNLVHCPDASEELFDRDLSIIENLDLRDISEEEFRLIKRFRSFNI